MASGIPLMLGLRTSMWDPYAYVVFGAPMYGRLLNVVGGVWKPLDVWALLLWGSVVVFEASAALHVALPFLLGFLMAVVCSLSPWGSNWLGVGSRGVPGRAKAPLPSALVANRKVFWVASTRVWGVSTRVWGCPFRPVSTQTRVVKLPWGPKPVRVIFLGRPLQHSSASGNFVQTCHSSDGGFLKEPMAQDVIWAAVNVSYKLKRQTSSHMRSII